MRHSIAFAPLLVVLAFSLSAASAAPPAPSLLERFNALTPQAEAGDHDAQRLLADIYMEGVPSTVMDGAFAEGPDHDRAKQLYEAAANAGDTKAQIALFHYYRWGVAVPQTPENIKLALQWLNKATASGDAEAQYEMGNHFVATSHQPDDLDQAQEWYLKSAEQGFTPAKFRAATLYYQKRDWVKYLFWVERAAADGYPDALFEKGYNYEWGRGEVKNLQTAATWYRKGVDAGQPEAALYLGWMYYGGRGVAEDDLEAKRLFEVAEAAQLPRAYEALGYLYYGGSKHVPQDYDKSAAYYQQAAAYDVPDAVAFMGRLYARGHGVPKDEVLSFEWTEKAALSGVLIAQSDLALIYLHGRGVPKDVVSAYAWCTVAAAREEPDAIALLAKLEAELSADDKYAATAKIDTLLETYAKD